MTIQFRESLDIPHHSDQASLDQARGATSESGLTPSSTPGSTSGSASGSTFSSDAAPHRPPTLGWFDRFPIRRKPLLAILTSNMLSVLGLVGAGSLLLLLGGRSFLEQQAQSELSATEALYGLELERIAAGLRGQAIHPEIIAALKDASTPNLAVKTDENQTALSEANPQVKVLLQTGAKNLGVQSMTLVGAKAHTIVSTQPNPPGNLQGDVFDPNGLVSAVWANPGELKVTERLPNQKDLIRYVLVPVREPDTQAVLGVLVAGDPVNPSPQTMERVLTPFGDGYSGVYLPQPDNTLRLTGGLPKPDPNLSQVPVSPPTSMPLPAGIPTASEPVIQHLNIADQPYTVAAKNLLNHSGDPVAVLVRGISETPLNTLIQRILGLQLGIAALILLLDILLANLLGHSIVTPIEHLRRVSRRFARGERQVRADMFADDEVGELALAFNDLAADITRSESALREQNYSQTQATQRANLLTDVTIQVRQSLHIETILNTAVKGVRTLLQADRVVIYRFNADFTSGDIAAESVGDGWIKALGKTIHDPLNPASLERYHTGRISKVENLAEASLTRCHCQILEQLEVKANLVAPILVGDQLLGLLCAHQCAAPRSWQPEEIELMQQLSSQVGYAITQATLLQQQQQAAEQERQLNAMVSRMRETLEPQCIFETVLQETRQFLAADRTVVYLFNELWEGTIVAESVDDRYLSALGAQIADPCFADQYTEKYRKGRVQATADIRKAGLTDCHIKQLEAFQIKANLVAPILIKGNLLGLFIAHHCAAPRTWQESEIRWMRQIAIQLGFALEQANLFSQKEQARLEAETLSEERQQQKEQLQQQLVNLLAHVEGAAQGDLTVRAEVTPGEIGTVADFFNAIIESLRQIVTQVKRSALEVNASLGENEGAVRALADAAGQQAEETTRILDSVEQMTESIQAVAQSAQQAAQVARSAAVTAETGGSAMDLTVHNILSLRETIGDTAKKVKRLGESSQQISRVVSLINQIALQTNLLAINAGIEAARAGEEGQGFALVAEEVGDLAARSAEATQEIEKVVATIQRETSQVVEAMEHSTVQVVEGTRSVEAAKSSLHQIMEVSRQIDQLVQSISAATVSQVATAESVSHLMQQVTQVSEQTSESSQQVATAIQQTVTIAQSLQTSVGTFTTGDIGET